jgi:glycosyltransferase involved in cell wall biosynthesis
MRLLVIPANDYVHNPSIARQQYIYEELAKTHEVHVLHFHLTNGTNIPTATKIHNATMLPFKNPAFYYVTNAPYHYYIINNLVRKHHINAIFTSNVIASSAAIRTAKFFGIPVIFDLNNWLPESAIMHIKNVHIQNVVRNVVETITLNNLKNCDLAIVPSLTLKNKLVRQNIPTQLILNGVDTSLFKPLHDRAMRSLLGIHDNEFCIGFIGNIEPWSGFDDYVRALVELLDYNPNVKLIVVGEITNQIYKNKIIKLCHDLNVFKNIIFTETVVPYPELPEYIASMDACTVLISPEEWNDNTIPTNYYECSACNVPVLMKSMPVNLNIKGNHIHLYSDQNEYVEQIKSLIESHQDLNVNVSEYSWITKAKQYEKFASALIME